VELLHRTDKTQVALLDEVQQRHAEAGVTLRQGDDETQVRLQQVRAGLVAVLRQHLEVTLHGAGQLTVRLQQMSGVQSDLDPLGELHLLLRIQQRGAPDSVEINTNQVRGRVVVRLAATATAVGGLYVRILQRRFSHQEA